VPHDAAKTAKVELKAGYNKSVGSSDAATLGTANDSGGDQPLARLPNRERVFLLGGDDLRSVKATTKRTTVVERQSKRVIFAILPRGCRIAKQIFPTVSFLKPTRNSD
jgi:hypothetical protein